MYADPSCALFLPVVECHMHENEMTRSDVRGYFFTNQRETKDLRRWLAASAWSWWRLGRPYRLRAAACWTDISLALSSRIARSWCLYCNPFSQSQLTHTVDSGSWLLVAASVCIHHQELPVVNAVRQRCHVHILISKGQGPKTQEGEDDNDAACAGPLAGDLPIPPTGPPR